MLSPVVAPEGGSARAITNLALIAALVVVVTFAYISMRELAGGTEIGLGLRGIAARAGTGRK